MEELAAAGEPPPLVVGVFVTGPGHHAGVVSRAVPVAVHVETLAIVKILDLASEVWSGNLTKQRVYCLAGSVTILIKTLKKPDSGIVSELSSNSYLIPTCFSPSPLKSSLN